MPGIINNCWRSVPLPCGQYKAIFSIGTLFFTTACVQLSCKCLTFYATVLWKKNRNAFPIFFMVMLLPSFDTKHPVSFRHNPTFVFWQNTTCALGQTQSFALFWTLLSLSTFPVRPKVVRWLKWVEEPSYQLLSRKSPSSHKYGNGLLGKCA